MLDVTTNNDATPAKICGKNHKCLQVLCGTAAMALQLCAPKRLRLLNGSGRYKLLILKNPDFAAVKRERLLNGSGGNSAFYGKYRSNTKCMLIWLGRHLTRKAGLKKENQNKLAMHVDHSMYHFTS